MNKEMEKNMNQHKSFYENPTQVKFFETDEDGANGQWIGGIAFQDKIICCECGATLDLDEFAQGEVVELQWTDVSREIMSE